MLGMLAVLAALLLAVSASGAPGDTAKRTYIVQMIKDPLVAYDGGVAGIPATKPDRGEKVDAQSPAARRYTAHLQGDHANALAQVGGAEKLYDYSVTFNGFAADLTSAQAAKLEKVDGVVAVTEDEIRQPDTSTTPHFIGLDAPTGLWTRAGGPANAGENVIIGVIDTGIWPEHPSFSDKSTGFGFPRIVYGPVPSQWSGICQNGEEWNGRHCNRKLIGARYFVEGFGEDRVAPWDYISPRDYNGHGSHTTSTAGGNHGVQATGDAALLGKISGMAPRARVAMYKVCWEEVGSDGGCANSDSVAAIDQAVEDGVDVLNFSISGTRTNFLDPVEVAFLFAADAGVFNAASAGNTAGASTVAHPSPWVTTVAAATHDRGGIGSVTLGNGATYAGASLAAFSVSGPFIDSEAAGKAGANATEVRLCFLGTLDPAKVNGKIVLCDRGVNARIDKSLEVKQAGGIGMVLTNTAPIGVNADLHFVPTVHLESTDRAAVKAYAATPGATATIAKGQIATVPAPFMAGFSSAGPLLAGDGDVLKPDVTAPGVDVLAAVAPPGNHGRLFDLLSGTSMSSPHVAGLGAMLTQLHPDWSPMMQKSALMTTAYSVPSANQFNYGAGHVDASKAGDPGLVYDSGFLDWFGFLCGTGQLVSPSCAALEIDPSDLNQASIAIGQLAGRQTVTRTVTNVGSASETYTASFSGLSGVTAVANPASFTIAPGATQTFTVTFTRTSATLNSYALGFLTLTGSGGHVVRSPIAVKPVALSAPEQITGTGTSGSVPFTLQFGFDGTWSAAIRGLIPADKRAGNVAQDPDSTFDTENPDANGAPGTTRHDYVVPAGTTYARFSLFDNENDGTTDDLDMYVYRVNADGTKTLVGVSGGGTAEEEVNLVDPAAATYNVYVHGWQTDGPDTNYNLFGWILGSTNAGNSTLTPSSGTAATGASQSVTFAWSGLTAGTKYLGRIAYSGVAGGSAVSGMPLTTVRIDG
jgi:hypothetical protein